MKLCQHLMLSIQITSYSQTYKNWEDEDVEEFYEKAKTDGHDGRNISLR